MSSSTTKYTYDDPLASTTTMYELKEAPKQQQQQHHNNKQNHRKARSSSDATSTTSDNGSLSYSAAGSSATGSLNSSNACGESTDGSFAEIIRVLDGEDVSSFIRREQHLAAARHTTTTNNNIIPNTSIPNYYYATTTKASCSSSRSFDGRETGGGNDNQSYAGYESLAYSTDADSHALRSLATDGESLLHGTDYLSTYTGNQSDQNGSNFDMKNGRQLHPTSMPNNEENCNNRDYEYTDDFDGANANSNIFDDVMFTPAEYADGIKRRKEKKRRERREEHNKQRLLATTELSSNIGNNNSNNDATPRIQNNGGTVHNNTDGLIISSYETTCRDTNDEAGTTNGNEIGYISAATTITTNGSILNTKSMTDQKSTAVTEIDEIQSKEYNSNHNDTMWCLFCFPDSIRNLLISTKQ